MSEIDPEISHRGRRRPPRDPQRSARLARRLCGVGVFLAGVAAVFAVVAVSLHLKLLGSDGTHTASSTPTTDSTGATGPTHHASSLQVNVQTVAALLAPASRVAAVPFGAGGALFLGGFAASGAPSNTVQTLAGASVQASGTLPGGDASAVAATLGSSIYLFGGAGSTIYEVGATGTTVVGSLPAPTADAAVATVGGTAYIIGGYTGASELSTIVAFTPGSPAQVVATLPTPLRFAAASTLNHKVYIVGGESTGVASASVYRFDPATKSVSTFTRLPKARDREAAATLAGRILVIGGASTATGLRTRAIYVINPHNGAVHLAGLLPAPLSDMTAVRSAGQILVAGGIDNNGTASSAIYAITVRR